jgi:hypothetical protein
MVFLTAYLTGIVLLAAYSGSIAAFLVVHMTDELPFEGFRGLLSDGSYRMGMVPGAAVSLFQVRDLKSFNIYIVTKQGNCIRFNFGS